MVEHREVRDIFTANLFKRKVVSLAASFGNYYNVWVGQWAPAVGPVPLHLAPGLQRL